MNQKAISPIYGVLVLVIIIIAVALAMVYLGVIPLSLTDAGATGDIDQPIGSDYCGYSNGEIIDMYENLMGKDLNNDIGFSVINALNMKACGSDSKLPSEILGNYMTQFSDGWYVLSDDTVARTGFYYRTIIWGNAPMLSNSSMIRAIISGNGVVVKEWYNYNTMTITSYGTKSGYIACVLWLNS